MSELTWGWLLAIVVASVVSLTLGLTAKKEIPGGDPLVNMFRRIQRRTGLIIGIGGWIGAIRILIDLLKR